MRPDHRRFAFAHARIDGRVLALGYRLEAGSGPDIALEERIVLPDALPAPDPGHPALAFALRTLHFVCGISYWKAACPPELAFDGPPPSDEEAALWSEVYTHGLGEFFYRNDLPLTVTFPGGGPAVEPIDAPPCDPDRALVLVGGGKDSAVAREALRGAGVDVTLLSLGDHPWIARSAAAMGDPRLVLGRRIDPRLFELNEAGAYNGHVPISAVIASAATFAALCGGYGSIVSANERSASYGNLSWNGREINHQWSKGERFEAIFQRHNAKLRGGPVYFSLLRPLSELHIGACFARHPRYFGSVTSCNANFRIRPGEPPARWCGRCPKCLFVSLAVLPQLSEAEAESLFGGDFLADAGNLPLLRQLAGIEAFKPFECVGTPEEVQAALWNLHRQGRCGDTPALQMFRAEILPSLADPGALLAAELTPSPEDHMPPAYRERLDAYLRAG